MKVFLDSNVLVSNYMWGGVCAEVVEAVVKHHEFLTSDVVLEEVERVLAEDFEIPVEDAREYIDFLGRYHVQARPNAPYAIPISDPDDLWVLASAVDAEADLLVTGDKLFRSADEQVPELQIRTPREFLDMVL